MLPRLRSKTLCDSDKNQTGFYAVTGSLVRGWMTKVLFFLVVLCVCGEEVCWGQGTVKLSREQMQELAKIRDEAGDVTSLLRKKDYEGAQAKIEEVVKSLEGFVGTSGLTEDHRLIAPVKAMLDQHKTLLEKRRSMEAAQAGGESKDAPMVAEGKISFVKDVAPIIEESCVGCHGVGTTRGRLDLKNFAGWRNGGATGALLVPKNAAQSLLAMRISQGPKQMPQGEPPLADVAIKTIVDWINEGAVFDGANEQTELYQLIDEAKNAGKPKVTVAVPDGTETVSFSKDIAPFFVEKCIGCHNSNRASGGLSMMTFTDLLRGGESGEVLIAGKLEESRLFRLTGGLENPRMPASRDRLSRKNYDDLRAWIKEGIKYDGGDPNKSLVVIADEQKPRELTFAELPAEEQKSRRIARVDELFKRSLSSAQPKTLTGEMFYLVGNVRAERLESVAAYAEQAQAMMEEMFESPKKPVWPDRLGIVVFENHFGYGEWNTAIQMRQVPSDMHGHLMISDDMTDAVVILEDTQTQMTSDSQESTKFLVTRLVAEAYLQRVYPGIPDWLGKGLGYEIALREKESMIFKSKLVKDAVKGAKEISKASDLLKDEMTGPNAEAISWAMTTLLTESRQGKTMPAFLEKVSSSKNLNESLKAHFGSTQDQFAQMCLVKLLAAGR